VHVVVVFLLLATLATAYMLDSVLKWHIKAWLWKKDAGSRKLRTKQLKTMP